MSDPSPSNSLGLDFNQLKLSDPAPDHLSPDIPQSPPDSKASAAPEPTPSREKKKPYVNPERVKTGGVQRDKLSEEALSERMARMREQNEKIKQRRLDVQADEDAFRQSQQLEQAKIAQNRKVQENIDRAREQNAKRKMDKIQSREWDSAKSAANWKRSVSQTTLPAESTASVDIKSIVPAAGINTADNSINASTTSPQPDRGNSNWSRGGSSRRGGRGRGRGGTNAIQREPSDKSTPTDATSPISDSTPVICPPVDKAAQLDTMKTETVS